MNKREKEEEILKEKALKVSIKEGAATSVSTGSTLNYITPFALALGAQSIHIGMLSSFSGLLSPIAQFFGSNLIGKYHRKRIVMFFVFLQALTWLPIAAIAFLFLKGILTNYLLYSFIAVYSISAVFGGLAYPAWFSWMGDIVPENKRGVYFSRRNFAIGLTEIIAVVISLFILTSFENRNLTLIGFGILFIIAFAFRFISFILFHYQYSPQRFVLTKKYNFSLKELLKHKNFKRFALYQAFFNLSIMIASPFFAVYMLKELNFSYPQFIATSVSFSVFYLLFMPIVGKFSDKYGNLKLMYISNILFAINPLLWIVFKTPLTLILIPQLVSGLANATFIIGFTNFTYSSVKPEYRGLGIAYLNIMIGIGTFIGSLVGGFILDNVNLGFSIFFFVFAIASALRIAVALIFLPGIKEEMRVKHIPAMHIHVAHPFKALHSEIGILTSLAREKYSEGLKVWQYTNNNVLQEKRKKY